MLRLTMGLAAVFTLAGCCCFADCGDAPLIGPTAYGMCAEPLTPDPGPADLPLASWPEPVDPAGYEAFASRLGR